MLKVENLYMKYKTSDEKYVLENLNFSVKQGEFHAFIGENGAGKSSTIKIIAGLNNEYDGNIFIKDLNIRNNVKARNSFSYVPDKIVFPSGINVWNYLYNVAALVRDDLEALKIEMNELFDKFDIANLKTKNPNKLSSGQIKKLLLILSIVEKSEFIILDEPTNFLDPSTRFELFNILKQMNKQGTTIMISSHILEEIKQYVDSATFIKKGKIAWNGKISGKELIEKYKELIL